MKALIVDDQSYVADGIYAGVNWEKLGIDKVYVAYSGSQAMQYIKNNQIDLVITDIRMPVMDGITLLPAGNGSDLFDGSCGFFLCTAGSPAGLL